MISKYSRVRVRYIEDLWNQYLACGKLEQLDKWISRTLRSYHQFGKHDRLAYADALFSLVRYSGAAVVLEQAFSCSVGIASIDDLWRRYWPDDEDGWVRALGNLGFSKLFVWSEVLSGRYETSDEDSEKRRVWIETLCRPPRKAVLDYLFAGIPPRCLAFLKSRITLSVWDGGRISRFLSEIQTRPPLWLRCIRREKMTEIIRELGHKGLSPERAGDSIAVSGDWNIRSLDAYRCGLIEIQDKASQNIVDMLAPVRGEFIWDACAGGGGKAIALASLLGNTGAVYASDIRGYKLAQIRQRAHRAGLHNVRAFEADSTAEQCWGNAIVSRGGFDRVLVDAPCSGAGTWRRNPDARWHVNPASLEQLTALQFRLLCACAHAVRPGGVLAYATCSWIPDENESIVNRFLAGNAGWQCERMGLFGLPDENADTMFGALLKKKM